MENENDKLKQYLLGNLASTEAEKIDLQIIQDAEMEERLHFAENELMESYLEKTLSPSEIDLFQKNFLVSPERQSHFRQIALLRNYARTVEPKTAAKSAKDDSEGFLAAIQKFFSPRLRFVSFALPLVVLALAIGIIFYVTADNQTALEKEFSQLNQTDLTDLTNYSNLTNIDLFPGTYRDTSRTKKLNAGNLTEQILIKLDLPVETKPSDRFRLQLVRNGKIVFTQNALKFYVNPHGRELRLRLPSSVFQTGEQQFKIEKENASESPVFYGFTVE